MSGIGREACWMFGSGQKALADVWEWSGDPPGCLGVVGWPSRMSGSGRKACWMSGSGQKALADVWEWSRNPPGCPRGPLGCPGVVGRPSRMSGSVWEAFPDVREWTTGPHK